MERLARWLVDRVVRLFLGLVVIGFALMFWLISLLPDTDG